LGSAERARVLSSAPGGLPRQHKPLGRPFGVALREGGVELQGLVCDAHVVGYVKEPHFSHFDAAYLSCKEEREVDRTPIVGVAMQLEQQVNLDNVARKGAGIRIPAHRWKAPTIQRAVRAVLEDGKYRENARRLQQSVRGAGRKKNSAEAIWQFVTNTLNLTPR
jgi:hypothetical protein